MKKQIDKLLTGLEQQGVSSALAVADHMRTVAGNGPEYSTTEAIKVEAECLAEWASGLASDIAAAFGLKEDA